MRPHDVAFQIVAELGKVSRGDVPLDSWWLNGRSLRGTKFLTRLVRLVTEGVTPVYFAAS